MGIFVSVLAATDAQIRAFARDAPALERWLGPLAGRSDACHLCDYWDGIHFVLTGGTAPVQPPLGALKTGDVHYRGGSEPIHAILGATTRRLASELQQLDEPTLRRRYDPDRMLGAGGAMVYPGRLWLGDADRGFDELLFYVQRLRDIVAAAAAAGMGLIFCRYESW
jgi:hypothetical protein